MDRIIFFDDSIHGYTPEKRENRCAPDSMFCSFEQAEAAALDIKDRYPEDRVAIAGPGNCRMEVPPRAALKALDDYIINGTSDREPKGAMHASEAGAKLRERLLEKKPINKAYVFNKRRHKAIVSADTVLGPYAIRDIICKLIIENYPNVPREDRQEALQKILAFVGPDKQLLIKTSEGIAGGVLNRLEDKCPSIGDGIEGCTFIDVKVAIAEAIRDDFAGFVLQALHAKWETDLSLEEAEKVMHHLNKLIMHHLNKLIELIK